MCERGRCPSDILGPRRSETLEVRGSESRFPERGCIWSSGFLLVRWFCLIDVAICETWPQIVHGRHKILEDRKLQDFRGIENCIGAKLRAQHSTVYVWSSIADLLHFPFDNFGFWGMSSRIASFLIWSPFKYEASLEETLRFSAFNLRKSERFLECAQR